MKSINWAIRKEMTNTKDGAIVHLSVRKWARPILFMMMAIDAIQADCFRGDK